MQLAQGWGRSRQPWKARSTPSWWKSGPQHDFVLLKHHSSPLHPCSSHPEPSCQPHRGGAVSASGSHGGGGSGCCCCCLELCSGQHSHPDPCMQLAFPPLRIMSQQAVGVGGPEGQWECGYTGRGAAGHPPPAPSTSLSGRCKDLLENTSTGGNHESADFKEAPGRHLRCPEKPGLTVQTVLAIPSSTQTWSCPFPTAGSTTVLKGFPPQQGDFLSAACFSFCGDLATVETPW